MMRKLLDLSARPLISPMTRRMLDSGRVLAAILVACMLLLFGVAFSGAGAQEPLTVAQTFAQAPPVRAANDTADGQFLRVYLATFEAGDAIEEKFGHDALWIIDTRARRDGSYNYGIFHMDEPHFMQNFIKGRMKYSMNDSGAYPTVIDIDHYQKQNRTIWVQELNLTPSQKASLRDFLEWNNQPARMYYMYDYFRDNCTTRIRDALDRVLNGQIRAALEPKPSGVTYRWQARRLLAVSPPAYAGIELAMGHSVDHLLDQWDNSFLPFELMNNLRSVQVTGADGRKTPLVIATDMPFQSSRTPIPTAPPDYRWIYLVIGVAFGSLFVWLARSSVHRQSAGAYRGFVATAFLWSLVVGSFGLVANLLWFATDHTVTRANENILQASVLSLILAVLLLAMFSRRAVRIRSIAATLSLAIAGLSILGFVMQILPSMYQFNGEIIGLLMPAHIGLAIALRSLRDVNLSTPQDE